MILPSLLLVAATGAYPLDFSKAVVRTLDEARDNPTATYLIRQASHGIVEKTFAVSEGQVGCLTYFWKRPDGKKADPSRVTFRVTAPKGFALLSASFAKPGSLVENTSADGQTTVTFAMTEAGDCGPFKEWNNWFRLGLLVRSTAAVGVEGDLAFSVFEDGKLASNLERTRLFTVPAIRARKPKIVKYGFHIGGWYCDFPDDAADRALADFWSGCGADWLIESRADKNLLKGYRAAGIACVTPDWWWIANEFRIGNGTGRPEADKFVLADTNKPPEGIRHAVCPAAVYEERPFFLTNTVPELRRTLAGFDGLWSNWEPEDYRGRGCACAHCRAAMKASEKSPEDFRAWQHAEVVKTVNKHVSSATGDAASVGFIPGVSWALFTSDRKTAWERGREMNADLWAGDIKWVNPWGPYYYWDSQWAWSAADHDGIMVNQFVGAKDMREETDRSFAAARRPKLMAFVNGEESCTKPGHHWLDRPEWLSIGLDAHFFNGFEAMLLYYFPRGYDARYWRAFAESVNRAATYEDFVQRGRRVDGRVRVTATRETAAAWPEFKASILKRYRDIPLLQRAAYEKDGEIIAAVFNFRDSEAVDFDLAVDGLVAGNYRLVGDESIGEATVRTLTADDLGKGVRLRLPPSTCRVWCISLIER